jgi:hypothetical protein
MTFNGMLLTGLEKQVGFSGRFDISSVISTGRFANWSVISTGRFDRLIDSKSSSKLEGKTIDTTWTIDNWRVIWHLTCQMWKLINPPKCQIFWNLTWNFTCFSNPVSLAVQHKHNKHFFFSPASSSLQTSVKISTITPRKSTCDFLLIFFLAWNFPT